MAYNYELHQTSLKSISKHLIKQAIYLTLRCGVTSTAPLGYAGDTIILHGSNGDGRVSLVSFRMHSGGIEMLVTDKKGAFIFYGKFDVDMGIDFIANSHWDIFNKVKGKIETELPDICNFKYANMPSVSDPIDGFNKMLAYQKERNEWLKNASNRATWLAQKKATSDV